MKWYAVNAIIAQMITKNHAAFAKIRIRNCIRLIVVKNYVILVGILAAKNYAFYVNFISLVN